MGVHDTVKFFQDKYGEKDLSVISIGPAGEKLVKFACWINEDDRASGRGGTGCVGGSKNLKAIVVKAEKKMVKAADRDKWNAAHSKALEELMDERVVTSSRKGGLSVYGTNVLMNMDNVIGGLPTKNSQLAAFGDKAELVSGEYVNANILVGNPTCHACPVACKKEVEIKEGPYKGLHMESLEYESAWAFGANCFNSDVNTIAKLIDQCNDYGIDTIETGNAISTFMEASEKGYTNSDGQLEWGDTTGMVALVEKIAFRKGVGDKIAEGPARYAKALGHPEISMSVKGQSIPAYDLRDFVRYHHGFHAGRGP